MQLTLMSIPLTGDPKTSLFRINRNVRFSQGKRPYKTNASVGLTRDGPKRSQGLVYIQIGSGECFAATGFFALKPDQLVLFRRHILAQPNQWCRMRWRLASWGCHTMTRQVACLADSPQPLLVNWAPPFG